MKILLKNGTVINVFTGEKEKTNVLIEDEIIIGVGDYDDSDADKIEDAEGKYICPGLIDGHMHIESTMLTPAELAKVSLLCGTTSIVADPHEIANVCGISGIRYMLRASKHIPLNVYVMLPSCVPATRFDEAGARLSAEDLKMYYASPRVLGLAEMMNYPGVLADDAEVMCKLTDAEECGVCIDGHAPLLSGKELDKYIASGIHSDHECSNLSEAAEKIRKGQWVMIREGTAARNLDGLIGLFDEPYSHRCLLVTDDIHSADLLNRGQIDNIIRRAVQQGKSAITGIRMATIQAAQCFELRNIGAIAPGYKADILVMNDLDSMDINDVYVSGRKIVENKRVGEFEEPEIKEDIMKSVLNSFYMKEVSPHDFYIEPKSKKCRVIKVVPGQLLTDEVTADINWSIDNGVDTERDILKIAVIERHMNTGHIGKGFISGLGIKSGAIASSVSHDSHNLIVIGANDKDMSVAANYVRSKNGGLAVVKDGKVIAALPLPIAGLMSDESAEVVALKNKEVRDAAMKLGADSAAEPFMTTAFLALPVIPSIKLTTLGLVDVNNQELVSLYV